jgi:tRNA threonylcarbamoyladenosine biosynthesis protein TsaE
METLTFQLSSPAETFELGRRLGRLLREGDFVALTGELGAGKTLFVRGVAEGAGAEPATSPSFALANVYRGGGVTLQHLDLYRLSGPAELFALGFEDIVAERAATLCEWADRASSALPPDRLEISFVVTDTEARSASALARGPRSAELLAAIAT